MSVHGLKEGVRRRVRKSTSVTRPESGGRGYDFPQNWSSLLLVKGTGRIQSSASIPLRRAGVSRRERFQNHGGAHAAVRRRAIRIHSGETGLRGRERSTVISAHETLGCFVLLLCSVLWFANGIHAQENAERVPAAVPSDAPADPA